MNALPFPHAGEVCALLAPLCWSVGHVGPIGTTVADVALGYALIAGPDAHDPNSLVQPPVDLLAPVEPVAVACHDVRRGRVQPGEDALVIGCPTRFDSIKHAFRVDTFKSMIAAWGT